MDYAVSHHLWRPLAAMSVNDHDQRGVVPVSVSPTETVAYAVNSMFPETSTTVNDDVNDVWFSKYYRNNSDWLFESTDSWEVDNVSSVNMTFDGFGFGFNRTNIDNTIELITMIVTAILLGLIILATVIGELNFSIVT